MKLRLLLAVVLLAPATLARFWGGRNENIAEPDVDYMPPAEQWTTYTTTYETMGVATESLVTVSTVVFIEHLYTTPGISTWENFSPDGFASTSTTFTTTTVTHIPHIVYQTSDWPDAQRIALAKRSTVSITDWVTVTRGPDNPESTSEVTSSSETSTSTSTPLDAPQTPPSWATAATSTASSISSGFPRPFNSSTSASQSPSSTSAVSGAPPITSSAASEASTSTIPSSSESPSSTSLAAPPAPVTSTAPIDSTSLTVPAGPPSSSSTTDRNPHPSTLRTLTTGFKPPTSSTITLVLPSHEGTHLSIALGPSKENEPPGALMPTGDIPLSKDNDVVTSVTAPFTLTLTAPPPTSTPVRCDNSWCSSDGTSYCMRWDGISGTNTFGVITPGEIFTTIGPCTRTVYAPSQAGAAMYIGNNGRSGPKECGGEGEGYFRCGV